MAGLAEAMCRITKDHIGLYKVCRDITPLLENQVAKADGPVIICLL